MLEPHVDLSHEGTQEERVVSGQRILQATSDVLLGWTTGLEGRYFYWRQLWDNKAAYDPETMTAAELEEYAGLCRMCLAQAHARSGDAATISGYIGVAPKLSRAGARFATAYADQNEQDYQALLDAVGRAGSRRRATFAERGRLHRLGGRERRVDLARVRHAAFGTRPRMRA